MQTMNFLVLTKSAKHNELCIAGVDLNTNKFTRLVADSSGKEIKKSDFFAGREVQILDIIEVLVSPAPLKIQSENVVLHKINKIINTLDFVAADKIMTNITNNANLLQTQDYAIQAQDIHAYNKSLMIAEVENFETYYNGRKTKAKFEFKGKTYTNFSVTDPDYFTKIARHNKCKLILSIPESEWNGAHFKFIAKVFCNWFERLIKWTNENKISTYKFPRDDKEKLKNIEKLNLFWCKLKSLPDEFTNLQKLENLDLSWNKFQEFPKIICELTSLKNLDLRYCNLKSLPTEFAKLQKLERLCLGWNKFQEFPKIICKITNLKEIDLQLCGLEYLPNEFANLQNLERLKLWGNKFHEFPKVINKLKNLKEYDIIKLRYITLTKLILTTQNYHFKILKW